MFSPEPGRGSPPSTAASPGHHRTGSLSILLSSLHPGSAHSKPVGLVRNSSCVCMFVCVCACVCVCRFLNSRINSATCQCGRWNRFVQGSVPEHSVPSFPGETVSAHTAYQVHDVCTLMDSRSFVGFVLPRLRLLLTTRFPSRIRTRTVIRSPLFVFADQTASHVCGGAIGVGGAAFSQCCCLPTHSHGAHVPRFSIIHSFDFSSSLAFRKLYLTGSCTVLRIRLLPLFTAFVLFAASGYTIISAACIYHINHLIETTASSGNYPSLVNLISRTEFSYLLAVIVVQVQIRTRKKSNARACFLCLCLPRYWLNVSYFLIRNSVLIISFYTS